MLVDNYVKVMPSKEARKPNFECSDVPQSDSVEWLNVLLSMNDDIMLIDEHMIKKDFGYIKVRDFSAIINSLPESIPLIVRKSDEVKGEREVTILEWVAEDSDCRRGDVNQTLANMATLKVVEKYIEWVKAALAQGQSKKIIITHFYSLLELPINVDAGAAVVALIMDAVLECLDDIIANYPEVLVITTLLIANYSKARSPLTCEFAHKVILKFSDIAQTNPSLIRVRADISNHFSVIDKFTKNMMTRPSPVFNVIASSQNAEIVNLVYPLIKIIAAQSPAKTGVLLTEDRLMDMLSPSCWLQCIVMPLVINDGERLTFPIDIMASQENENGFKRTIRATSTLNEEEKKEAFKTIVSTTQYAMIDRGVSKDEWRALLSNIEKMSDGILSYNPTLVDIFSINKKNQSALLNVIKGKDIKPLFELSVGEMNQVVSKQKPSQDINEQLTEEYLHFLDYNVLADDKRLKGDERVACHLNTLLSLNSPVRKCMVGAITLAMEEEGLSELPWLSVVTNVKKVRDASFMVESLNVAPYELMVASEVDVVKTYCMDAISRS